ncbi:chromosome partitioning protein ParB [Sporanaerobium hydrogeniformans]|uniref:Chromosome partitioning protein ParB n=1 Tax=Sporanaerobium hydrogeniformans TaxID=3072179 RepID=A0AC61D6B6_9FIRM|nr:ParB/RepB/Spo0J family partition protein [Sporanaerobium hydrogeniformans]PHV69224.1 chromosome partitioning protein ParB [Sporanaerobium hydrogeniformans]
MGKFSINDLMNTKSRGAVKELGAYKYMKMNTLELIPSEDNFYSMNEIEELAESILLVGLQQPIVLGKVEDEYRVISGHRRLSAMKRLLEQGHNQFEKIECLYAEMSESMLNLSLIVGNAFTRKMTDYDLVMQEKKLKEALLKAKEAGEIEIKGKLRDFIAELMDVSRTKVGQIEAINNNLSDEAKEELKEGNMNFTTAYEVSRLTKKEQEEVVNHIKQGNSEGVKDIIEEKKEQKRKEQEEEKVEPVLREPAAKELLGQPIKVSETDTQYYKQKEYTPVEILQELIIMNELITDEEFEKIATIFYLCRERR